MQVWYIRLPLAYESGVQRTIGAGPDRTNSGAHWHIGRLLGRLNQHFWGENPIFRGEKVSFLRFFTPGTSQIANLTPESDSTPKITIETTLRWALAQNWRFLRPVLEISPIKKDTAQALWNFFFRKSIVWRRKYKTKKGLCSIFFDRRDFGAPDVKSASF